MYNVFYSGIMIVGIIKIETGLVTLEEFRNAIDETTAVLNFCNEYNPSLNTADYLGINADSLDLNKSWAWDFNEPIPAFKEIEWVIDMPVPVNLNVSKDYYQYREYVRGQLNIKTWANLSNKEKDLMIKLHLKETSIDTATDESNKVTYLIATGQATNTEEARLIIVNKWSIHHISDIESCNSRATSQKLYEIIATYLTFADATDFFITVENLYIAYRDQAIKGTKDNTEVGIFDYIESTPGTVYEFAGLASKGYIMQTGDIDESNFINELMKILRDGIY